jgi:ABC-type ATPase involved in cell division
MLVEPTVLLADEPTASLDSDASMALVEMLGRWLDDGGAMVLVAHDEAHWQTIKKTTLDLTRKVSKG